MLQRKPNRHGLLICTYLFHVIRPVLEEDKVFLGKFSRLLCSSRSLLTTLNRSLGMSNKSGRCGDGNC